VEDLSDYLKYRGKCKEYVEKAVKEDPTLLAVRGFYYDAAWGRQAHWWCLKQDGTIFDPTAKQFPSKGYGVYEEFDGFIECEECGKTVHESKAIIVGNGNYAVCSYECNLKLVGLL
jgi:hypothetical protein